jgi:uncharacterized iron-regulated membrane protein
MGLILSILVIISAVTGVLLGWKKQIDLLQPPTQQGQNSAFENYASVDLMMSAAVSAVDSLDLNLNNLDRLEYRPKKGIAKAIFDEGNWEVQLDATTLTVLSVAKRNSDWIERLHDGSIISEGFKLTTMNILGFGLLFLVLSGLWLWYGPRKIKFSKLR